MRSIVKCIKILVFLIIVALVVDFFLQKSIHCGAESPKVPSNISEIKTPAGYKRITYEKKSYSRWVQRLPLKKNQNIKLYNGITLPPIFYNIMAVVDKPLLYKKDLEQCADYAMRFWADYHKDRKKLKKLYLYSYGGKKKYYRDSGKSYKRYLENIMIYSNSYSIKSGAEKVSEEKLRPGDMFVQNQRGGIGHVSVIVDMCKNRAGKKLYLIGYSYMPAQEFHIEKAPEEYGYDGWFSFNGYKKYLEKNMPYGKAYLRRFK